MGARKAWREGPWPMAAAVAVAVVLGGCSSVPDAANPVKWYENTVDLFTGDDKATAEGESQPVPNADKPFPNLASVPDKPQVSTAEERRQIAQGLVPDNERRRYAADVARQGAPTNMLSEDRPAVASASTAGPGAPAALPPVPAAPSAAAAPEVAAAPSAPPAPSMPTVRAPRALAPDAPPPPSMTGSAPPPAPRMAEAPPAARRPALPPLAAADVAPRRTRLPIGGDSFPTVVVSSSGVDEDGAVGASMGQADVSPLVRAERLPDAANARGQSIKVATIQFAHGSADLDSRDRTILRNVVALQRERGGVIRVVGHASSRTANMPFVRHKLVNYDMSSERAETVARTLSQMGAKAQDIVVVAKSDADPLYYEFMPSGEAGNRRTEVYLDF